MKQSHKRWMQIDRYRRIIMLLFEKLFDNYSHFLAVVLP